MFILFLSNDQDKTTAMKSLSSVQLRNGVRQMPTSTTAAHMAARRCKGHGMATSTTAALWLQGDAKVKTSTTAAPWLQGDAKVWPQARLRCRRALDHIVHVVSSPRLPLLAINKVALAVLKCAARASIDKLRVLSCCCPIASTKAVLT